ncbi:sensor histidine kinase [Chryseobacterium taiwanense]|nr:histidine kinase [Chryseobacterium taiwanense]
MELVHQKDLLNTIVSSQEKERHRIGMDLHDEIGANLSAIKLLLTNHFDRANQKDLKDLSKQIMSLFDQLIDKTRLISHDLSPSVKGAYGFSDAVLNFADQINQSENSVKIHMTFSDDLAETYLQNMSALLVYRIVLELINNSFKHARANNISVIFNYRESFLLIDYYDDGIGLKKSDLKIKKGIGFRNIESRLFYLNGTYEIIDNLKGTHVQIKIP